MKKNYQNNSQGELFSISIFEQIKQEHNTPEVHKGFLADIVFPLDKCNHILKERTLGLDVGVASVGWAIVDKYYKTSESKNEYIGHNIVDANSVIFKEGIVSGKKGDYTRASARREARGKRKTLNRKKGRKKNLKNELNKNGFDFGTTKKELNDAQAILGSPYKLRSESLTRKLTEKELGYALYNLSNLRGYYDNSNNKTEEDGKVNDAIDSIKSAMESLNFKTIGQYFYQLELEWSKKSSKKSDEKSDEESNKDRIRGGGKVTKKEKNEVDKIDEKVKDKNKTNKTNVFVCQIGRDMIFDEFVHICNFQSKYYPKLHHNHEFYKKIKGIIFDQLPITKNLDKVGACSIFEDEKRIPSNFYLSEMFALLNNLRNNYYLVDQNGEYIDLKNTTEKITKKIDCIDESLFKKIIECVVKYYSHRHYENGEVSNHTLTRLNKVLKEFCKNNNIKNLRLSLKNENKKESGCFNPVESMISCNDHYNIEKFGVIDRFSFSNSERDFILDCLSRWTFKDKRLKEALKTGGIDNKGNTMSFNDKEIDYILKNFKMNEKYIHFSNKALSKIVPLMLNHCLTLKEALKSLEWKRVSDTEIKNKSDFIPALDDILGETRNPNVRNSLGKMRSTINSLLSKYQNIDYVNVEIVRDLFNGIKKTGKINALIKDNEKVNNSIRSQLKNKGVFPSKQNLNKMILFKEMIDDGDNVYPMCPYTGTKITIENLFSMELEHIVPNCQGGGSNRKNLTLATRGANQEKGGLTPYQAYGHNDQRWDSISNVYSQCLPKRKRELLLNKQSKEDSIKSFSERQLCDTAYIAKQACKMIEYVFPRKKIRAVRGGMTSDVRSALGLNEISKKLLLDQAERCDPNKSLLFLKKFYNDQERIYNIRNEIKKEGNGSFFKVNDKGRKCFDNKQYMEYNKLNKDVNEKFRGHHHHHAIDAIVVASIDKKIVQEYILFLKYLDTKRGLSPKERKNKGKFNFGIKLFYGDKENKDAVYEILSHKTVANIAYKKQNANLHNDNPLKLTKDKSENKKVESDYVDNRHRIEIVRTNTDGKKTNVSVEAFEIRENAFVGSKENHHLEIFESINTKKPLYKSEVISDYEYFHNKNSKNKKILPLKVKTYVEVDKHNNKTVIEYKLKEIIKIGDMFEIDGEIYVVRKISKNNGKFNIVLRLANACKDSCQIKTVSSSKELANKISRVNVSILGEVSKVKKI